MKSSSLAKFIPATLMALGAVALASWWNMSAPTLGPRLPGADRTGEQAASIPSLPNLHGQLTLGDGQPLAVTPRPTGRSEDWPGWRGPARDGISPDSVPLAKSWPAGGPPVLWQVEMGEGHAGAAIKNGCVYVMDYDRDKQADALRCLSLADGREIWRYSYPVKIKRNHGMSRTVPAVNDKYVIAIGPLCHVTCLDAHTGQLRWALDLPAQFGTEVPPWYAGQCPLLDGDKLILAPGGPDALLLAVDCNTGSVLWKCENPYRWAMSHSSIMPMELSGRRMYLYAAAGGVAAVSADDGKLLLATDLWKISIATVPSPLVLEGGRVFFSGGYNAGSMIVQFADNAGVLTAQAVTKLKPEVFGSEQQTPLYYKGRIFGLKEDGQMVCLNGNGQVAWTSSSARRFGKGGPYLIADGLLFVMGDTGKLSLLEASDQACKVLAEAQVLPAGQDSWAPMALADGKLIARDLKTMVCLDVRASK